MMMGDIMIDNWNAIFQILQKVGASEEQIADALSAYRAICFRWLETNASARAFEDKVREETPTLYLRCMRPAGLVDSIMHYERESWPPEWQEDYFEAAEDGEDA